MSCCIAIGFFELPGLAGGFLYTKMPPGVSRGANCLGIRDCAMADYSPMARYRKVTT